MQNLLGGGTAVESGCCSGTLAGRLSGRERGGGCRMLAGEEELWEKSGGKGMA